MTADTPTGSVAAGMRERLMAVFAPERLVVIDESHLHAGHAGSHPGGQSHFRVEIVAAAFAGLSRVERHRRINQALAEWLAGPVHALSLVARAPGE
jgi:BolA protein